MTETPSGSITPPRRSKPRLTSGPSWGHRGLRLPTEKLRPPGQAGHRDLVVALHHVTIDERVCLAEMQIRAAVEVKIAEQHDRHVSPLQVDDGTPLAFLGLGEDEVRLPGRRLST